MILDEATASLDTISESHIIESVRDAGKTCIIVAHRLSTVRECDFIVVLSHGKIVQQGTHESLMAEEGLYRELVRDE